MEDREIVALFYKRDEQAIRQCERQYGRLVRYVASRILDSESEAEDVAGDTWLKAWNAIPPATPEKLGTYLAMIARQTAIDRLRARQRISRGGGSPEDSWRSFPKCSHKTPIRVKWKKPSNSRMPFHAF